MAVCPVADARRPSSRPGFTLIELLVVISIIAILSAILLPAVKLVRDAAYAVRCAGQQGQVCLAVAAYTESWEGMMPYGYSTTPTFSTWADRLVEVGDGFQKALNCPANRATPWSTGTQWNHSYLANLQYWNPSDSQRYGVFSEPGQPPIPLASLNSGTVLIADGGRWFRFVFISAAAVVDTAADPPRWHNGASSATFPGELVARHRRRIPAGFADGHVQSLTIGDLAATPNSAASPRIYPLLTRIAD